MYGVEFISAVNSGDTLSTRLLSSKAVELVRSFSSSIKIPILPSIRSNSSFQSAVKVVYSKAATSLMLIMDATDFKAFFD